MAKTEAKTDETKDELIMEYRLLGNTGLKVSVLGFGTMSIDSKDQCKKLLKACRPNKNGINFFDNAELYGEPCGMADKHFGDALKELQKEDPELWKREDLVITGKIFFGVGNGNVENTPLSAVGIGKNAPGVNEIGLSKKHLYEGMKGILKRLSLDYVDVVFAHRLCAHTPMEEIVRGFNDIIERGEALYWGMYIYNIIHIYTIFIYIRTCVVHVQYFV